MTFYLSAGVKELRQRIKKQTVVSESLALNSYVYWENVLQ